MKMRKYAQYLLNKNKGDIDFTMKIVKNNAELSLEENDEDRFLDEVDTYQQLEVEKAKKAS